MQPLKLLVESVTEEKKKKKIKSQNKKWAAQGLQERRSPASTASHETPVPAVSKYSSLERNEGAVKEEQMGKIYQYKHNVEQRGCVF